MCKPWLVFNELQGGVGLWSPQNIQLCSSGMWRSREHCRHLIATQWYTADRRRDAETQGLASSRLAIESLIHVSTFVLYWCLVPDECRMCYWQGRDMSYFQVVLQDGQKPLICQFCHIFLKSLNSVQCLANISSSYAINYLICFHSSYFLLGLVRICNL